MEKKLLIAEDEPKLRNLLTEFLEDEGFQVISAADGEIALELLAKEAPDLLILDIKMPNLTGLDVLEAIRRKRNKLPIIISSAYNKMQKDITVLTSNVVAYLIKPLDLDVLLEEIEKALS